MFYGAVCLNFRVNFKVSIFRWFEWIQHLVWFMGWHPLLSRPTNTVRDGMCHKFWKWNIYHANVDLDWNIIEFLVKFDLKIWNISPKFSLKFWIFVLCFWIIFNFWDFVYTLFDVSCVSYEKGSICQIVICTPLLQSE